MASIARQDVTIGTIISATIETVKANARPMLYYVGLFTIVGTITDYAAVSGNLTSEFVVGLWQVSIAIASVVAMYFLIEAMLRQSALMDYFGPRRILPFLGQAIVIGFAVVFGLILLIVPGLILAAQLGAHSWPCLCHHRGGHRPVRACGHRQRLDPRRIRRASAGSAVRGAGAGKRHLRRFAGVYRGFARSAGRRRGSDGGSVRLSPASLTPRSPAT